MTQIADKNINPEAAIHTPLPQLSYPSPAPVLRDSKAVAALYIHIPFCFHKCHYCDFYTAVIPASTTVRTTTTGTLGTPEDEYSKYVDRLLAEIKICASKANLSPKTIFVGGGTPTLLSASLWQHLLHRLTQLQLLTQTNEFTVEANPETVTPKLIKTLAVGGVNRISIGAQSFDPLLLEALGRWHEPVNVVKAVGYARDAGINNVNLDLIFAVPGQTMAQLQNDIDAALRLNPTHISCYNLTYEPNTALTKQVNLGRVRPIDNGLEAEMYSYIITRLHQEGFEHYEVSNWARPDQQCEHNLMYWTNQNWLGVGPSAASHIDGHRWKNLGNLNKYLESNGEPPITEYEYLSPDRAVGEYLMLRLRTCEGVSLSWLEANLRQGDERWQRIDDLTKIDMLKRDDGYLRLTNKGLMVADSIVAEML